MGEPQIEAGSRVVITDANGDEYETEALGTPMRGRDMVVVWVNNPRFDGTGFDPTPWPIEAVRLSEGGTP